MSLEFSANLSLLTDHDIHSNKNSNTLMLAYTINMHFNSWSAGFAGINCCYWADKSSMYGAYSLGSKTHKIRGP